MKANRRYNWASIGRTIRQLRIQQNLSQQQLADASGVDRTLISRAENGRLVLPLGALSHIAESLGVSLMDLLNGVEIPQQDACIIRESEYEIDRVRGEDFGYTYQRILTQKDFAVLRVRVPAGKIPPALFTHREKEFGYVVSGCCVLRYGSDSFELSTGDSYWIDGRTSHVLIAKGDTDCIVIVVFMQQ
jgi:transcriptional regulator with XRE-family HTH domain